MRSAPIFPITAFVGPNGYGKTLAAVALMLAPAMTRGTRILTNLNLDGYENWLPLESWRQIPDFRNGILLLDEMNSLMPAREYRAMPAQLVTATQTLRHSRVRMGWTEPAWEGADAYIRRVTQGVYKCKGFLKDAWHRQPGINPFPLTGKRTDRIDFANGEWPPNRLFNWQLYDTVDMEEFTLGRAEKVKHKYQRWYWRPAHRDQHLYDSNEFVGLLDHLDISGVCPTCDGTRRRHACKCRTVTGKTIVPLEDFIEATDEQVAAASA